MIKKLLPIAGLLIFLSTGLWGQAYTWTGAVSDVWADGANWAGGTVPDNNVPHELEIAATMFDPDPGEVPSPLNITRIIMTSGAFIVPQSPALDAIRIDGGTLAIGSLLSVSDVMMTGGLLDTNNDLTARNITIADAAVLTGTIYFSGGGSFSINGDALISGVTIDTGDLNFESRDVRVTQGGAAGSVSLGSNGGTGRTYLTINGGGTLDAGAGGWVFAEVTINANVVMVSDLRAEELTVIPGAALVLGANTLAAYTALTNSGTLSLEGNLFQLLPQGMHTSIGGSVVFTGGGQTLAGITNFTNVTISAGIRDLAGDITVTGELTISGGGTLNAGSHTIFLNGGTWNRAGIFNPGIGTVNVTNAVINNNNTFYDVNGSGTVRFANGSTQTILGRLDASGASLTAVNPAGPHWNLYGLGAANFIATPSTSISWCNSSIFLNRTRGNPIDGGNNIWVFAGETFTWTGAAASANWNAPANWLVSPGGGRYPPPENDPTSTIIINQAAHQPVLDQDFVCGALTIALGAELNFNPAVNNVTVQGTLTNAGTLNLRGMYLAVNGLVNTHGTILLYGIQSQVSVNGAPPGGIGGTIHYFGSVPGGNRWVFGDAYENLTIAGTAAMSPGGDITVSTRAEINSAVSAASIAVNGSTYINSAAIVTSGPQTYGGPVRLGGLVTLDAGASLVRFAGTVNSSAGAPAELHVPNAAGALRFEALVGGIAPLVLIDAAADVFIGADITTGGLQSYAGTVTLGGGGRRILTGTQITLTGLIGSNHSLDINGNAVFNASIDDIGGSLVNLSVSGTAFINADISTAGWQMYGALALGGSSPRELSGAGTLTLGTGSGRIAGNDTALTLNGDAVLNGTSSALGVLAVNGHAVFQGAFLHAASVSVSGESAIRFGIVTNGPQEYADTVTLAGNVTLDSGNGEIRLAAVTYSAAGNFRIENGTGTLTLGGDAVIGGSFIQEGTGDVIVHGNIASTNADIFFAAPVQLQSGGLGINSGSGAGAVTFADTLGGLVPGFDFTISAGTGSITFGGPVGSAASPLGELALINASLVHVNADVFAALLIFDGGPNQRAAQNDSAARLGNVRINNGTVLTLAGNITQRSGSSLGIGQGISGRLVAVGFSWQIGPGGAANTFTVNNGELFFGSGSELHAGGFFVPSASPPSAAPAFGITFGGPAAVYVSGNVNIGSNVNLDNGFYTHTANDELNIFTLVMNGNGTITSGTGAAIGSLRLTAGADVVIATDIEIRGDVLIEPGTRLQAGLNPADSRRIHVSGYDNPLGAEGPGARWFQTAGLNTSSGPGGVFVPNSSTVEFGRQTDDPGAGRTFQIAGDTTWHILACHEPLANMLFSNHPHTHNVRSVFRIEPRRADGSIDDTFAPNGRMIRLSRLTDTGLVPFPHGYRPYVPPAVPNSDFWYFYLSSGAELHLNYVYITYSFSRRRIPLPLGHPTRFLVIAVPYYSLRPLPQYGDPALGSPREHHIADSWHFSFFNVNWFAADNFFYSFTEDSNRNGRIDRIRAQAAFELMGENDTLDRTPGGIRAFDLFDVEVDGYRIDRSRGVRGFRRVSEVTGHDSDRDSIYIFLEEKPYSDAGAVLTWRITQNESLFDLTTRSIPIGVPAHGNHHTFDTVPPRINYAFTLPGHPELFFQMSEPAALDDDVFFDGALTGLRRLRDLGRGNEFLVELGTDAYTIQQLAAGGEVFRLNNVRDRAPFVPDRRSQPELDIYYFMFPSPKYPIDWDYSGYVEITGRFDGPGMPFNKPFAPVNPSNTLPPIRDWDFTAPDFRQGNLLCGHAHGLAVGVYGSGVHRVTDMLVSIPPQRRDEVSYFIWPLWARYEDRPDSPDGELGWDANVSAFRPGHGYMGPGGSGFSDATIIWDFTGRRFLEQDSIIMQALLGSGLSGTPLLVPAFNINDSFKSSAVHGSPGLWHTGSPSFVNMVPRFTPIAGESPHTASPPLFNYRLDSGRFPSNGVFEFFFRLDPSSDLLAGRLDISPGSAVPADWFRRVRPFAFGVHGISRQRSGVTILNNVINSSMRERVFLDFRLLRPGRVTIQVFTLDGTLVRVLEQGHRPASGDRYHRVYWDGTNNAGRPVARGMYFIRVVAPDIDEIRKVMVVR